MYIGEILAKNFYDVKPEDSVLYVVDRMNELHVPQLPVIDSNDYLGLVSKNDLLTAHDNTRPINSILTSLKFVYLYEYQHIYDALQYMSTNNLTVLAVLDKENSYIGVVTQEDLLNAVNNNMGNTRNGAIIVLEVGQKDLSFSHIAHIVEAENIRLLSMSVHEIPESTKLEVTIKVDKQHIDGLVASLWRFDYIVKATFNDGSRDTDIKERYDILMNYLNL